jgi:hypothetical protein
MRSRNQWWAVGWVVVGFCGTFRLSAQQPEAAPATTATGVVTGRVVAQDTQRPARFAVVMLQRVSTATAPSTDGDGPQIRIAGGGSVNTRTDAEGNFAAEDVAPGDYYVTANAPGYVPLRLQLQAQMNAGADPAVLLAAIPQVHVDVQGVSSVTVNLERGGTISGRVQWEDGSPAGGVTLTTLTPTASATGINAQGGVQLPAVLQAIQSPGGGANVATTDDRGAFRISGLPSGDYLLRSVIQQPSQTGGGGRGFQYRSPIRVYSPGVFRRADAKTISVKAGEERGDVRMAIDLRALRTVSGHVGAASGPGVASGRVSLVDTNDSDLQLFGSVAANGDFALRYIPAGSYTLRVSGASSEVASGRGRDSDGAVTFRPFTQTVVVSDTDVTGLGVTLTPVSTQP